VATYPGYFYDIKRLVAKYMRVLATLCVDVRFFSTGECLTDSSYQPPAQSGSPFSYKDFKMLWKEMRFSYIHHAKPLGMEYGEYMQRLYSSTLGTELLPARCLSTQ
jgi:hypothetical protein